MRRDKKWWRGLTKYERIELVFLEKGVNKCGGSADLPEGYGYCEGCDYPVSGGGLCMTCFDRPEELLKKADYTRKYGKTIQRTGLVPQFNNERKKSNSQPWFSPLKNYYFEGIGGTALDKYFEGVSV